MTEKLFSLECRERGGEWEHAGEVNTLTEASAEVDGFARAWMYEWRLVPESGEPEGIMYLHPDGGKWIDSGQHCPAPWDI